MIAVDTSAIIAIIRKEASEARLSAALENTNIALISTANVLELQLVITGQRALATWGDIEILLTKYGVIPHPFDERQSNIAREAAVRFGKGRHKAGLNFGDCFAYALARSEGIPLLCTGNDFVHTDVELV